MSVRLLARLGRSVGHRFLFEWGGTVCVGVAALLLGIFCHLTASADHLVYDVWLRLHPRAVSPDIVVVDIDNASVAALGRWPWPRSIHAKLVDRLADDGAAAIVYDVLFTEPSPDDAQFARALARRPSFLPVLLEPADETGRRDVVLPVASLGAAAAGRGHINLEVDGDGVVRSVALFEGDDRSRWPQLMLSVWRAVRSGAVPVGTSGAAVRRTLAATTAGGADSEARVLIPFSGRAESYRHFSFADVLAGRVPPDQLRGRVVLVGATASGLYDRFSTPLSGDLGPMPGVYIHANVLDMLLNGTAIEPAAPHWVALASLVLLATMLACLPVLSPLRTLLLTAGLCLAALAGSSALLFVLQIWFSPVPAMLALVVVYLAWSWRRLEMTMSYLRKELRRLADEPYLLPEAPAMQKGEFGSDPLAQQMMLMAQAAQRLQDMRRFVWDSLDSVPEPILVADLHGVVLIANHAAREYFARLNAGAAEGRRMQEAFGGLALVKTIDASTDAAALALKAWPALLDPARSEFAALMAEGIEVRDVNDHEHVLRYARCTNAQGLDIGWIAGLFDVTALRDAERQREDALRLLSHDMRSPQASILALIETERERGTIGTGPAYDAMARIERYARRALVLADDFVQLARAESQAYAFEPTSLAELLIDASDEVWPQAQAKGIQIDVPLGAGGTASAGWVHADRSLMARALVNVLNNAVKYSPPATRIVCTIGAARGMPARVVCSISDQGYGIAPEDQARLFEPFRRFHEKGRPEVEGVGLGMVFVKTVVSRHGGDVFVESEPGKGTTLTFSLPGLDAPSV
ncbi:histidine kinase [Burkholderia sp. WAC0059]|uniref:CHASE2 domain-containing protein n=1 Tax=Burkholderia sp. WAC0059 TaxID=2066022 RepID=UPI000C7F4D44|nr:CHASE2 domain-containing protein [Burkholderia sp. WAC0059]PLZ01702.1 histidine kinase [Burkholderia sp. WAC0059]